ncbi:DUF262 domain-containing protein [Brachyspira aalborgi]|uniref:DUF262 domain-containing protein n=1 Tax=Brachyspira aalborgi TaxID=29522 RepID=A0A5C8EQS5_9SPIR|nr:DUF262 domain-containing protein [Brachyspira aalborgi]TXJ39321.1 DUF262 domain-containing protein [Brachyspira aalborgi]
MIIEKDIINIKDLLEIPNLKIPDYQRPYKWKIKNVNQLIDDILFHKDKQGYRLGTLVLHKDDENNFNIVDGQQRVITIFLLAYCLSNRNKLNMKIDFSKFSFDNKISQNNIKVNYSIIDKRIEEFDNFIIEFFLNRCELVKVVIDDVQEAFQFFDSQNARGKDLEPHDLLKAFHLREMSKSTEDDKIKVVEEWENLESKELTNLFANYLFKIRNWSKGNSAYYFTKNDIDIFKGVNIETQNYPFMKQLQINNYYVDKQNEAERVNNYHFDYPFQIDQIVINGKRFFEMVIYYNNLIKDINALKESFKKDTVEYDILNTLDTYRGHNRSGDRYVRNMFNCALVYYIDKFGKIDLDRTIKKLFIWAYNLRFKLYSVKLVSVDNYAVGRREYANESIFRKIYYAVNHNEILHLNINSIKKEEMKRKIKEFEKFI